MAYSILKQKLTEIKEPSHEFWKCFENKLFQRNYSAKDIWLKQGNVGKKIGFLVEGGAISYIKKDSQNLVNKLWLPNDFILSASTFTRKPSVHTIEFRGESHIVQFSIEAINQLIKTYDEALFYVDYFFGLEMRASEEHTRWLKSFVGEKRHTDSIKKYGQLYSNLTNSEKASFIGVSERWISNLKKKQISKKRK